MERTYATSLCFLEALINYKNSIKQTSTVATDGNLSFMRHFIEHCKLQPRPKTVLHLAGTKGKGTTAVLCEALLRSRGLRTALFTSPHLCSIRERIAFDGAIVSENVFTNAFFHLYDLIVSEKRRPHGGNNRSADLLMDPDHFASFIASHYIEKENQVKPGLPRSLFFCFMTLLFLAAAKLNGAQVLIVETGIGGRLDATNSITGVSVCGITSIGWDHMEILGNTLEDIAREKAGITRFRSPIVVSNSISTQNNVLAVFKRRAAECEATLYLAPSTSFSSKERHLKLLGGSHMCENAALALSMIYLHERGHRTSTHEKVVHLHFTSKEMPQELEQHQPITQIPLQTSDCAVLDGVSYPGRSHIHVCSKTGTLFLLDGAHTPESMGHCARWANSVIGHSPNISNVILLFACNQPRDPRSLIASFLREAAPFRSLMRQIVIVRAASQDKSLRGEIRRYLGKVNIATERQSTNQNAVDWQKKQADLVRLYIQEQSEKANHLGDVRVSEIYLSEPTVRHLCAPNTCIISCGSLYHVGEILSILSTSDV